MVLKTFTALIFYLEFTYWVRYFIIAMEFLFLLFLFNIEKENKDTLKCWVCDVNEEDEK